MKEQYRELALEHTEKPNLSFYRHSDGKQSVQVMDEYYSLKEAYQNQKTHTHSINIEISEPTLHDDHAALHEVFHFRRKNRKSLLQKARCFFLPNPDEFKNLDSILHQANTIRNENDRLDAITHLSMHVDDMVDQVENQCLNKAGFLTLVFTLAWFFPIVSHISILHAEHPFLWNFAPPLIALSVIITIGAGIIAGSKYFFRKSLRLQKYSAYAKRLDQALVNHKII